MEAQQYRKLWWDIILATLSFSVDRLIPAYTWQPSRVRFHGLMPKNRFVIAPKE